MGYGGNDKRAGPVEAADMIGCENSAGIAAKVGPWESLPRQNTKRPTRSRPIAESTWDVRNVQSGGSCSPPRRQAC